MKKETNKEMIKRLEREAEIFDYKGNVIIGGIVIGSVVVSVGLAFFPKIAVTILSMASIIAFLGFWIRSLWMWRKLSKK